MTNFEDEKQKRIDKAIAMKEKSIAYFNSVNAAISKQDGKDFNWDMFVEDRDKFYQLWQEWYMENKPAEEAKPYRQLAAEARKELPQKESEQLNAEFMMAEKKAEEDDEWDKAKKEDNLPNITLD